MTSGREKARLAVKAFQVQDNANNDEGPMTSVEKVGGLACRIAFIQSLEPITNYN